MSVFLNVRNEVAPRSHLRADVEKLRNNRQQKMAIAEEIEQISVVARLVFVLAANRRELRSPR